MADRTTDALIQHLIPSRVKTRAPMTREEFETLVEMREEQGLLDMAEASIIQEALDLEKLSVRDCMVPRVDLALLSAETAPDHATLVLDRSPGRYVVVHGETPDAVVGIIDTQAWRLAGRPPWQQMLRHVPFVPETMPVLDALEKYLKHSPEPVLILDEYGGLEGMLSQEEIADWLLYEAAPWQGEAGEIRDLGNGRFLVDGGARVEDVAAETGLKLPTGGIDTIGGYVLTQLGHAPKAGERIQIPGADLKVRRCVRARIQQLDLRLHAPNTQASPLRETVTDDHE
jgi:putative hemolysin